MHARTHAFLTVSDQNISLSLYVLCIFFITYQMHGPAAFVRIYMWGLSGVSELINKLLYHQQHTFADKISRPPADMTLDQWAIQRKEPAGIDHRSVIRCCMLSIVSTH